MNVPSATQPGQPGADTSGSPAPLGQIPLSRAARDALDLFDRELREYLKQLPRLLQEGHTGRTALARGDHFSVWDTQADAIQAGHALFGLGPFFVQTVHPNDVERYALLLGKEAAAPCPSS